MSEPEDPLLLLLRFARRLALERTPSKVREVAAQFALEVVAGDAAALVLRGPDGEIERIAHFGASLDAAWPDVQRVVSQCISSGRPALIHTDPDRATARPDRGRLAAAPCPIAGRRGALLITRLNTAAELRLTDLGPIRMVATVAGEALRRAHAEHQVAQLDLHLAAWTATATAGVLLIDPEGMVARLNPRGAAALGATVEAVRERRLADVDGAANLAATLDSGTMGPTALTLPGGRYTVQVRPHRLGAVVLLERQRNPKTQAHRVRYRFEDILTQDPEVLRSLDAARQTAQSGVSILITGESGTGKEVLAQAIHHASPRSAEPFVAVNVAAIPADLLESELFGYEAGAFTGAATQGKPGSFEQAGRGTLLLDEIGEMPPQLQSKLLRVLQERQIQRLGGTVPIPVNARVLATTNRDLQLQVRDGRFRLDLYHRLKVVSIGLPPLRLRPADVALLADHYLRAACDQLDRPPIELGPAVMDQLQGHTWPGNIRELGNLLLGVVSLLPRDTRVIDELPIFLSRPELTPVAAPARSALPPPRRMTPPPPQTPTHSEPEVPSAPLASLAELERQAIARTLAATGRNFSECARILGVSRTTLYKKVRDHGL